MFEKTLQGPKMEKCGFKSRCKYIKDPKSSKMIRAQILKINNLQATEQTNAHKKADFKA